MKRTINITLIALFFTAGVASAQVTFQSSEIAAQTSWSELASYEMSITARAGQSKTTSSSNNATHEKTCTVLDVDGAGRIDAVQVTYGSASNGNVSGRSYIVTPRNVSYAGGGAPTEDELRFVRGDNASFGQFRALDRIFGGRTFNIGQSFEPNRNDAEELVNVAAGTRLRSMALTLRSVANGIATFDVSMKMESDPKEKKSGNAAAGQMTLTLDGELDVTVATSRPVRLEASGVLNARTKKADGSRIGDATGDVTIRRSYAF
jgi:hypothetical protein